MESSLVVSAPATSTNGVPIPLVVSPSFLLGAFALVPDRRRRQGMRCHLASTLALALVANLSQHACVLGIAQWTAETSPGRRQARGFAHGTVPRQPTLRRLIA
jgi:hypothetical protein